ncbi:arginine--tRNA ligase [Roseococcus sp. SDR]|uniref:arginine--tRNA ligase n=1 Tax=Roseococcus sp. SDR TaxID=2835532 RepID=UPI001BCDE0EC|nr:arginine--tRNA ligase [Roseococcus sp. SDR]MBS7793141.1 arginine--tRNA ligase [Roseococcus sp. SDR]MBV1848455.1 arginine--tRNA ligase [Roseococcus sp. SDR]
MSHDIFAHLRDRTITALRALLPEVPEEALSRVIMEPPRDASHGDMATNAALVVGKVAKMAPPKLAAELAAALKDCPEVEEAAPAGPGFVNLRLREDYVRGQVAVVLREGEGYGQGAAKPGSVNVEYVSANPTGPMHVGHCRGAVVGDALAGLLAKAGHRVTREYYINDAGAQVQALAYAAYWRYLQALGTRMTEEEYAQLIPGGLQYRGEYLIPVGQALMASHGSSLAVEDPVHGWGMSGPDLWLAPVRAFTVAAMMAEIREDLAALGVQHDIFISEAQLVRDGVLEKAEALLDSQGLIYRGTLPPPKGKLPEDWEEREQTLFRSEQFGDDTDRPLRKSDGSGTYFANDIANHLHKIERGFDALVHVWGADHGGYVKRMQAAVAALSGKRVSLDVVLTQIVHVMKDGQPVRMSKRAGSYITLRDLIDEVGKDAVRFTMLTRKSDAQMEFDLDLVVQQSRDNPVFYVQYAHARCRSVLRGAGDPSLESLAEAPLDSLTDPAELGLIRRIASWPRVVEAAAAAREPHRVAFFLNDLASDFHLLWNKGKEDTTLRFIQADQPAATQARLALVAATAAVVRSGLRVMGVTPVEEMR